MFSANRFMRNLTGIRPQLVHLIIHPHHISKITSIKTVNRFEELFKWHYVHIFVNDGKTGQRKKHLRLYHKCFQC
jgi:hypothetical protein